MSDILKNRIRFIYISPKVELFSNSLLHVFNVVLSFSSYGDAMDVNEKRILHLEISHSTMLKCIKE